MKALIKSHRGLLITLLLCCVVMGYAAYELYAVPQTFQRAFLPLKQTTAGEDADAVTTNHYLRDLIDKAETITTGLSGSCEPTTLYAVGQPATITMEKQKTTADARLVGIDANYLSLENFTLYGGRYFYPDEYLYGQRVALVDEQLAVALFQYAEPLLEEIKIGEQTYRIIGIVRDHKRVGDQLEYSAYVPYRSLINSSLELTEIVYEAAPVKGAGGWAAFQSAVAALGDVGVTTSLPKESMNGALPLRFLGVIAGAALAFFFIGVLNRLVKRLYAGYKARLREEYASKLLGGVIGRGLLLAAGYSLCLLALAQLFVVLIAPVYTFPEWVPAILVEPKDIAAAFWNVWQSSATAVELRTPELMRIRFYSRLMGWACGFCALFAGVLWGYARPELLRLCHMDEDEPLFEKED